MKLSIIVLTAVVMGAGCSAYAQVDNSVQIQLRFVEQLYGGNGGPSTGGNFTRSGTANVGSAVGPFPGNRTRTFEIEYTMTNGSGATFPAGLVSGVISITGPVGTYSQALLTKAQAQVFNATTNPTANQPRLLGSGDTSGPTTGSSASGNPSTGVHEPYRGGFSPNRGNNADASNGTVGPNGILSIVPLALTQTLANPITPNWYGLFSFSVVIPDNFGNMPFVIHAGFVPDAQTGALFGFFDDGVPTPVTSTNGLGADLTIPVIFPAPGTLAVLGLGGLIASRRRRTGSRDRGNPGNFREKNRRA